jgi:hypothetical protein
MVNTGQGTFFARLAVLPTLTVGHRQPGRSSQKDRLSMNPVDFSNSMAFTVAAKAGMKGAILCAHVSPALTNPVNGRPQASAFYFCLIGQVTRGLCNSGNRV